MGSLFKQLISEVEDVPQACLRLFESHGHANIPVSDNVITRLGASLCKSFTDLYFVLDGLDECSDEVRWGLMERLRDMLPHVRLLVTSRYRDDIKEELYDFIPAEIHADKADVEIFIDDQIQKNRHLSRKVDQSPRLRADIKEAVVRTAQGMQVSQNMKPMLMLMCKGFY